MKSQETLIKYKKYLQLEIDTKRLKEHLYSLSETKRYEEMNELFETDFNRFNRLSEDLHILFFRRYPEKEAEYIRRTPFPSDSKMTRIENEICIDLEAVYSDFGSPERKLYDEAHVGVEQKEIPDIALIDVIQDKQDGQITIGISDSENKYDIQFTNNELSEEELSYIKEVMNSKIFRFSEKADFSIEYDSDNKYLVMKLIFMEIITNQILEQT